MSRPPDIPPGLRGLYEAAGPVVRCRLVCDVLGRDESYLQTGKLVQLVERTDEVRALLASQGANGFWGDADFTALAVLRFCELGLESHRAVIAACEGTLVPALRNQSPLVLHALVRSGHSAIPAVQTAMESMLSRWETFLSLSPQERKKSPNAPTEHELAAFCCRPWTEAALSSAQDIFTRILDWAESEMYSNISNIRFRLPGKEDFLSHPHRLFFLLELSARIGVTRDLPVTCWLIEELEARQDADGFVRFDSYDSLPDPEFQWYFPLEENPDRDYTIDWTFRALHVFKLLEYDV